MNNMVSILIATHNRRELLEKALDSLKGQTYTDYEIIVVDDGSSDDTETFMKSYCKDNNRVEYIRHSENLGLAFARNTGINHSKGGYIALMDDDDLWIDKEKIEKQVRIFDENEKTKLAIVASSINLVNEKGEVRPKLIKRPQNLEFAILKGNGFIYSPTVLMKKELVEIVGGYDTNMKRGVDSDFFRTCVIKKGLDVQILEDVTVNVNEFGEDRITSKQGFSEAKSLVLQNLYLVRKYLFNYILHPLALYIRVKSTVIQLIYIIRKKS